MGWLDKARAALGKATDAVADVTGSGGTPWPEAPFAPPSPAALADAVAQLPAVAAAQFPDDAQVAWSVSDSRVVANLALVEAMPSTDVGYAAVTFAFRGDGDRAEHVGTYVPGEDAWQLLSATVDDLPLAVHA
jgi:hypothetical protein